MPSSNSKAEQLFDLAGKTALVTGGSRGIGRGLALGLARQGADVAIIYRSAKKQADEVTQQIEKCGCKAWSYQKDLSQTAGLEEFAQEIWQQIGKIDILVNNAGLAYSERFNEIPIDHWRNVLAVNLDAVYFLTRYVAERMIASGIKGRIINISSANGFCAEAGHAHYNASKGALELLTQTFAIELGEHGITANTVCPGIIETESKDRMTVERLVDESCHCGETPLWHPSEKKLYWTDIDRGRLYRFNPNDCTHECVYEDRPVGGFTVQADGKLLLFRDRGNIVTWSNGKIHDTVVEQLPGEAERRFNDVIADPAGRVFCGTLSTESLDGRLYRLDPDGTVHTVVDQVHCSNGMGFTNDVVNAAAPNRMYFTETMAHTIWLFDYDQASGALSNQRPFLDFTADTLLPDGLTIDAQGDMWSAFYGASCVIRFGPDGKQEQRFSLPTECITCPTFGGEDLSDLYITSAGGNDKQKYGDAAGALFRITTHVQGLPEYSSRVEM